MGEFGWAYISGSDLSAAQGTDGSVQVRKIGGTAFSGSESLTYDANNNLRVTGSVLVQGRISASAEISASAFWGDGSNLSGIGSGLSISSDGANRVLTSDGDNTLTAEANLVFDGSTLTLSGDLSASVNVSASAYYGDGSNLSGITSVNIANDGANRILTADGDGTMSAESSLTFDGTTMNLTGTLNVSGTINANQLNINVENRSVTNISVTGSTKFGDSADDTHEFTGSLIVTSDLTSSYNISASHFHGDGSKLTGIASTLNDITNNGNTTTNAMTASALRLTGLAAGTATTSSYLALDSSNNVVLTSSSGGGGGSGGTIGAAEDAGGYTDGLFTDFTTSTAVGVPIDRFNEVLKILAPTPAPNVKSINEDVTDGVTAKLSFGASFPLSSVTSSATTAGFDAVDRTGSYSATTSGSNIRLGVYDGTQDITGIINHDVVQSVTNGYYAYTNDAFGSANEGTLKLELNGTVVHSIALSGLAGAGSPPNGSANSLTGQSGFTNVSVTASSFDGNNSEWYIFKYRTAKYKIAAADQKVGWNYLRVIHTLSTDNATNYIEWINDTSGAVNIAEMSASNSRIDSVALVGSKYLSGVEYNTDATANYKTDLLNLYNNVYAASGTPISFTTTNSSTPSAQGVGDIGASEGATKVLGVTGSLNFNQTTLFNATMSCNVTVTHPLKQTITNTGSAEANGFLIETRTLASTNLEEKFHDESFRKTSGSYDTQGSVTATAATWSSQNHMTGGGASGHTDGLLYHNQRLYSPVDGDIPNGGNFASIPNTEAGNPNYSTVVGTRTFYRVVSNSSGVTKRDMKIVSTKNSTRYNNSTLGASNVHFFVKIPGATGWMDISQPFVYGSTFDGNGALITTATNNSNTSSTDSGNATHFVSFGTQSVSNDNHVMVKVLADESWGGYLSELSFSVGATTNTTTNTGIELDNIDLDDTAGESVRLSFGTNNNINQYSNATGSSIGLSNFNINSLYDDEGTTRRGVFKATEVMGGTLNENISANGSNYPANSFKDAFTGSLFLIVNGVTSSTMALDSLSAGNNLSSDTGFTLGAVDFSTTSDGIPDYTKPYRTGTYSIGTNKQNVGWNYANVIHNLDYAGTQTIVVTVVGGIFYFDGVKDVVLSLKVGNTYRFDTSHSSNSTHPLAFSTTSGGSHNGGSPYTTGVSSGSGYIEITPQAVVTLYPYCTSHPNMGGTTQLNITAATKVLTNYVEWIVDPSGSTDDTAVSTPTLSDFGHTSLYYQSGIGYYATNPTASFDFSGSNFYRNVYQDGTAISFPTTTNCAVTSITTTGSGVTGVTVASTTANLPLLNSSSNCHLTELQVTGALQYNGATPSISGGLGLFTAQSVTTTGRVLHPFKSDKTTNSASKNNLFVYSGSLGSTNLSTAEYFGLERYRVVSGNYANQAAVTSSANAWNSQTALNGGNSHDDGMVTAAGFAISPFKIGVAGNTGHASLQAPAGNPDYSSLTNNVRTYYRYFKYTSASTVASFTLTLRGDANLVGKTGTYAAALGANKNCFVELKVAYDPNYPGADDQSTGWADCAKIFDAADQPNNDGAGIRSGDMSGEDQTIDSGGLALSLTLGTRRIKQNQHVLVKVSAHKDWTGYLSRIEVTY